MRVGVDVRVGDILCGHVIILCYDICRQNKIVYHITGVYVTCMRDIHLYLYYVTLYVHNNTRTYDSISY